MSGLMAFPKELIIQHVNPGKLKWKNRYFDSDLFHYPLLKHMLWTLQETLYSASPPPEKYNHIC